MKISLRERLANAEETLRAIRSGEVDTVVMASEKGTQIFTLEGEGHAYRVLIESMNEGALTLSATSVILYSNQCFARMLNRPLNKILGFPLSQFLPEFDPKSLKQLLNHQSKKGGKIQTHLLAANRKNAGNKLKIPVQISFQLLENQSDKEVAHTLVITDITEAKQNEEMLRALNTRVIQIQESERSRIAIELHDGITQSLCAVLFRSQALVSALSRKQSSVSSSNKIANESQAAANKLEKMIVTTIDEVERLSTHLRPSVLEDLGLIYAFRELIKEFMLRTKLIVVFKSPSLAKRLTHASELALYRILQEGLRNIEKHAKAKKVVVKLSIHQESVEMIIKDNGIGIKLGSNQTTVIRPSRKRSASLNTLASRGSHKTKGGLGLLSMRERAVQLGGILKLTSIPKKGTQIEVNVPIVK